MNTSTINSLFDESLGGKPGKNVPRNVRKDVAYLWPLALFILTIAAAVPACFWLGRQYDSKSMFYICLITGLLILTTGAFIFLKRD
ncbi:MAG: hypothetical protein ACI4UV_16335 [Victivallales bacterium]